MINEMLLGYITGILNRYIGDYFENIDSSQLTGSLFGGGVTLNDLSFRSSIFEPLGLPFHLVAGRCGTLEIKYTLRKLYSEPVIVNIKDLHMLIIPARCVKYDANAEKARKQLRKMRRLEIFESIKHHIRERDQKDAQKLQEATYFDMWVMQVLRNIQFQIESLHIRFEDDITNKKAPFSVGIALDILNVLTTDANWKNQFVKEYVPETIYKLVKVNGLSLYWNPAPTALYKGVQDQKLLFSRLKVIPTHRDTGFKFLFAPLQTEFKVQITPFPDLIKDPFSKPRLVLETGLPELVLYLSDKQFVDIFMFFETLEGLIKSYKNRKHRADLQTTPYHGHYKEWWHFAYNCILDDIRRRRKNYNWANISQHRQNCKKYMNAYYKKNVEKKSGGDVDTTISTMEQELDLFNLILSRKQVDIKKLKLESKPPEKAATGGGGSWLTSFFYPSAQAPASVPAQQTTNEITFTASELTEKEKEDIRIAVGFAKRLDIVNIPENYVEVELNALLNEVRLIIHRTVNRKRETVLETVFERFSFGFRFRPVGDGVEVELKMGRIEAFGGDFPRGALDDAYDIPHIITTANAATSEYFLKLLYEKAPLDSEVDHKVCVEGLALQITYDADTFQKLNDCFTIPHRGGQKLGPIHASTIINRITQFKSSTVGKLLKMMENKGKVELSVCLITPYLVIPQDSSHRGKSNFIVVRLGEVNLIGTIIGGTLCANGACTDLI